MELTASDVALPLVFSLSALGSIIFLLRYRGRDARIRSLFSLIGGCGAFASGTFLFAALFPDPLSVLLGALIGAAVGFVLVFAVICSSSS